MSVSVRQPGALYRVSLLVQAFCLALEAHAKSFRYSPLTFFPPPPAEPPGSLPTLAGPARPGGAALPAPVHWPSSLSSEYRFKRVWLGGFSVAASFFRGFYVAGTCPFGQGLPFPGLVSGVSAGLRRGFSALVAPVPVFPLRVSLAGLSISGSRGVSVVGWFWVGGCSGCRSSFGAVAVRCLPPVAAVAPPWLVVRGSCLVARVRLACCFVGWCGCCPWVLVPLRGSASLARVLARVVLLQCNGPPQPLCLASVCSQPISGRLSLQDKTACGSGWWRAICSPAGLL